MATNGHAAEPDNMNDATIAENIERGETLFAPNGPMDIEAFRRNAYRTVDFMCDYFASVEQYPVASQVSPGYLAPRLPSNAPEDPESFEAIMKDFSDHIMPGVTHWQVSSIARSRHIYIFIDAMCAIRLSRVIGRGNANLRGPPTVPQSPSFFAFYPATSSYPSLIGDMLSSMINCIGFNWICSPACTELEVITMDWLCKLVGLPEKYLSKGRGGGVIQQSASDATFVAMVAARQRALRKEKERLGDKYDEDEAIRRIVCYMSEEAHSCHKKGAMVLKLKMKTLHADDNWVLHGEALEKAIQVGMRAGWQVVT